MTKKCKLCKNDATNISIKVVNTLTAMKSFQMTNCKFANK